LPALSFGYLHGGLATVSGTVESVVVAGVAVGLGLIYQRTRSIAPCLALHLCWIWLFVALSPGGR